MNGGSERQIRSICPVAFQKVVNVAPIGSMAANVWKVRNSLKDPVKLAATVRRQIDWASERDWHQEGLAHPVSGYAA